ncbi:MAG: glycerol-3-phosphate 1-O-acyltransferase PlsY [Phycisphaerales bacterium]
MTWLAFMAAAFVSGSIPTGLWIARLKGVDIRAHGSGNIGATNVGRVLGARYGLACFIVDAVKGLLPAFAAGWHFGLLGGEQPGERDASLWLIVMTLAVLGHVFTPWARFRGGKGVATGLGAMLGVYPYLTMPAVGALAIWIAALAAWRYVSLASIIAALALPVLVLAWAAFRAVVIHGVPEPERAAHRDAWVPFFIVASLLAAFVVVRHRGNIRRLREGREFKIGRRVTPGSAATPAPSAPNTPR